MNYLDATYIQQHLHYPTLVAALQTAFAKQQIVVPPRHHHDMATVKGKPDNTLLLMPAWKANESIGVKIVSVHPDNGELGLPAIQGLYFYLDAKTGNPLAIMDAKALTTKRTAATSALASSFLSRPDTRRMLMVGTGALAPELIKAHCAVRPIEQVYVWGRHFAKAKQIADSLALENIDISAVESIATIIPQVDLISCATLSSTPLVSGRYLQEGQHLDLVGAYKPDMREADDTAIQRSDVYLDSFEAGLRESGDIVQPLQHGILQKEDILADLFGLCKGEHPGRTRAETITLFKSVGHALEDWVAARLLWEQKKEESNN